jgi:hypothetical protein
LQVIVCILRSPTSTVLTRTTAMTINTLGIVSKVNWAILPVSCIMIGFCYLDRSNIAYMQLQLKEPPPVGLGFSEMVYGQGSGLFFIGYSLFQIPSNIILVRVVNNVQRLSSLEGPVSPLAKIMRVCTCLMCTCVYTSVVS